MKLVANPHDNYRLGDFLLEGLESDAASFSGASAFARRSGIGYLAPAIHAYSAVRPFRLIVGIDLNGTSVEALELLLASAGAQARLFIFHNPSSSFHPKAFRFEYSDRVEVYVGSGNLTKGGLFRNYEIGLCTTLMKGTQEDDAANGRLSAEFDRWSDAKSPVVQPLTERLIKQLMDRKLILTETAIRAARAAAIAGSPKAAHKPIFRPQPVPAAPMVPKVPDVPSVPVASATASGGMAGRQKSQGRSAPLGGSTNKVVSAGGAGSSVGALTGLPTHFVMTVQNTDAGVGQTTPGTQKRAAEVFIPLASVREQPDFWGWPGKFQADPKWTGKLDQDGRGKMDQRRMPFYVEGSFEWVTMTYNSGKGDFRLRNSALRDSGNVGDILRVSRRGTQRTPVYVAEFFRPGTPRFAVENALCITTVRPPSKKRYGYY